MKRWLVVICLLLPLAAEAARFTGQGFSIELPAGWETERNLMNVPLIARPPQSTDAEGWGQDLLTVTREPHDRRRSCLDSFTQHKLGEYAYHASQFAKLEEVPLELPARNGHVATLLTLRYQEGPRELMAYVLVMDAGSHFLTAAITSSPARFEFQRARFRQIVESLRPASAAGPAR